MANAVTLVLYNDNKEILLQLRDEYAERNPNKWGFFGGAIDEGESPGQAVIREAKEELGYATRNPQLILTENMPNDGTKHLFIERFDDTQTLHLGEGKAMQWFSLDELETIDMITSHRVRLAKLIAVHPA